MGRSPCCDKVGMKKGVWTPEEDNKLFTYMQQHGHAKWRDLPLKAGLRRCGKSCRLRWNNYLRPDIKRGEFSLKEGQTIIQLHALLGNRWSRIARHLPKRTDNEIKNYWNTNLKKRLAKMGIDPTTHKPINCVLIGQPRDLSHMAQWETTRIEAEARIVSESKLAISDVSAAAPPPPPFVDILKVWQGMTWTSPGRGQIITNNDFFASDNMLMTISNKATASAPSSPPPPPGWAQPCLDMIDPKKDDNVVVTTTTPNVGLRAHESAFPNNGGNDYAVGKTSGNYDQDVKINGILIENPSILQLEDHITADPIISNSTNYNIDGYLTSSSNLLATDLQASINASTAGPNDDFFFEDNKGNNYSWSNILNIVNSPADWPVI
ncbi:hypothetical protein ABFX02_12G102300 [Erythranthe guttata]